jgi:hypothetical protein
MLVYASAQTHSALPKDKVPRSRSHVIIRCWYRSTRGRRIAPGTGVVIAFGQAPEQASHNRGTHHDTH